MSDMNKDNIYDLVIVGAGPAGLSAAIYMARARYKTLILEKDEIGGQIKITDEVVNYPGIRKISGKELTADMFKQARTFGADYRSDEVIDIKNKGDIKEIILKDGNVIETFGIVLAPGANPRSVGFKGENEFKGHGVAYCATCDGEFFTDLDVFVVGGGFAAVEESIFLTKYAKTVTMLVRRDEFRCAKSVVEVVEKNPKIKILYNTEIDEVYGSSFLEGVKYYNNKTGEKFDYVAENGQTFGVFVFAGYKPATEWLPDFIELSDGYIVTDGNQKTNIDGIYAAGDVCIKDLRQVVTATSDGAVAATSLEKYISKLHDKYEIERDNFCPAAGSNKSDSIKESSLSAHKPESAGGAYDSFITEEIRKQLIPLFSSFQNEVVLTVHTDASKFANDLAGFAKELASLSDKIDVVEQKVESKPHIAVSAKNRETNIMYYSVPGGHEFNSFIVAMYNVAGPGQETDKDTIARINALNTTDISIVTTLACTMCPACVVASQKIASINPNVTARMYVLSDYPELKQKHKIMSVPCIIINDDVVHFGKKDISEMLNLLEG